MSENKTHWKKYMNPDYLGAWSIPPQGDLTLTVAKVVKEEVVGEKGKKELLPVIHWRENQKPMVLNVTNSKMIQQLYGTPYVEDWVGKQITLYQAYTKMAGEEVECVRIRPAVPQRKKKPFTPDNPRWDGAVQSIANGDSNIETIKKHFDLSEEHEAIMKQQVIELTETVEQEQDNA